MPAVLEREPVVASDAERKRAQELENILGRLPTQQGIELQLVALEGIRMRLAGPVLKLLKQIAHELARGKAVRLTAVHPELTTQQAAEILNVSRPFLVKLLESGEMPFHKVGTHRRVALQDVLAYKARRSRRRRAALAEMTREAQKLGAYD